MLTADTLEDQIDDEQWWTPLQASIEGLQPRLIRLRRRLHAIPEASGCEQQTTLLLAEILRDAGITPTLMENGCGLIADIHLGAPSNTFVALRSELDAVNVHDNKSVPYASTQPDLCHACGHDAHTSILMATALTINKHLQDLSTIKFRHNLRVIFQPAEETAVGARSMIKQGALNGVSAIVALHADPFLETGTIGLRNGAITGACKTFKIAIKGRSGHTARPHEAVDPIPAATSVIDMFYQLGPRSMDSRYPLALTVSSIMAGQAVNAIPSQATIAGTLRTARLEDLEAVQQQMIRVVESVGHATSCQIDIEFVGFTPPTNNDSLLTEIVGRAASDVIQPKSIQWLDVPSLGGEDFAFYQELIPGTMFRLGTALANPRQRMPLHSSHFDIDERALGIGALVMTRAILLAAQEQPAS
ncbi:MAG: amidohydrolase [Phycisphaerales bacterium]|nr:amidohydrolase [Phycisphaerales bacterium]